MHILKINLIIGLQPICHVRSLDDTEIGHRKTKIYRYKLLENRYSWRSD